MDEGMTPEANEMMDRAAALARSLGHDRVGTEHALYAFLTMEEGPHRLDNNLTPGGVVDAIQKLYTYGLLELHQSPGTTPRLKAIVLDLERSGRPVTPRIILDAILGDGKGRIREVIEQILHKWPSDLRRQLADMP